MTAFNKWCLFRTKSIKVLMYSKYEIISKKATNKATVWHKIGQTNRTPQPLHHVYLDVICIFSVSVFKECFRKFCQVCSCFTGNFLFSSETMHILFFSHVLLATIFPRMLFRMITFNCSASYFLKPCWLHIFVALCKLYHVFSYKNNIGVHLLPRLQMVKSAFWH